MDDAIRQRVDDVLTSGYLTEGPVTREFEEKLCSYIGCRHAIALTSCTTGLEVALRCLGIGEGDEVIVPNYTYPATASAAVIVGAKPVLVDVDPKTMLIDYDAAEAAITGRTRAIIPVSQFGNPLNYQRLDEIKREYGIFIVEDAACAVGAEYKGKKVGTFADISVFSFHPRKFITTGEGGMVTTDNDEWAGWIRSYIHFGMAAQKDDRRGVVFERIGTNYKMSNILAAVGLGQLEKIDTLLQKRRESAAIYAELLNNCDKVVIPSVTRSGMHSYQSFCVCIDDRDRVMQRLRQHGIEAQIGTYALHAHPAFGDVSVCRIHETLSKSTYLSEHCITLPLYYGITPRQQEQIVSQLR